MGSQRRARPHQAAHVRGDRMSEHDQRGFASMDEQRRRRIASEGGKASHRRGKAHEFSSEEARSAGRKGGMEVSRDRQHMSAIGRKGGMGVHVAPELSNDRAPHNAYHPE